VIYITCMTNLSQIIQLRTRASSHTSAMKIYTKTGDSGSSSLYNGERRRKTNAIFAALGDTDECSSAIAIAREYVAELPDHDKKETISQTLEWVQSKLLDVGSCIATPPTSSDTKRQRTEFCEDHAQVLEDRIDELNIELPALTMFILPSGGMAASHLHLARSVCRRAERSSVSVASEEEDASLHSVMMFLNRLSDYLFTAARMCSVIAGREETTYRKET
jgi:cob(I)alamin adenosyltransferase